MKKLVFALVALMIISSSFSMKIDPQLLKEFSSKNTGTINVMSYSIPTKDFLVLYKGQVPSGDIIHKYSHFNVVLMRGTLSEVYSLAKDPNVIFIYSPNHNFTVEASAVINSSSSIIGDTPEVFSKYNGTGIKIAILDNGINWDIPALNPDSSLLNISFTGSNTPGDHGTFVASEIVSQNSSYPGIARAAKIYNVKVMNGESGDLQQLLAGLDYIMSKHPNIVSMSLGSTSIGFGSRSEYLDLLFNSIFLDNNNVAFVVAAGNNGVNGSYTIAQPGSSAYAFTVGAVNSTGQVATYSSRGPVEYNAIKPDVCAEGTIHGFTSTGTLEQWEGTSMATPLVSGAIALLEQKGLNAYQAESLLMETATPTSSVWNCGAGIINITKALDYSNSTFFTIEDGTNSINYLGYVSNITSLYLLFYNHGTQNMTISYNITYYNGTLWKSGSLFVKNGSINYTTIKLVMPNLNSTDSYGWIVTNNSLHMPFSWASAKSINPNDLFGNVTGSSFYVLNTTQYSNIPQPCYSNFAVTVYNGTHYYATLIMDSQIYDGFASNNINTNFTLLPVNAIMRYGNMYCNFLPWNATFYGFKYLDKYYHTYTLNGEGMITFSSGTYSILVNGVPLPITSQTEIYGSNNVFFLKKGDTEEVVSLNPAVNVSVIVGDNYINLYSLVLSNQIPAVSSSKFSSNYDTYFILPNTTNAQAVYTANSLEVIPLSTSLSISLSQVNKNTLWTSNVTFDTDYDLSGVYPVYMEIKNTVGLFSDNQTVLIKRYVDLINGRGNVTFEAFIPNYVNKVYFCFNTTENCVAVNTTTGTLTAKDFSETWLNDLISTISRMVYLYTH